MKNMVNNATNIELAISLSGLLIWVVTETIALLSLETDRPVRVFAI